MHKICLLLTMFTMTFTTSISTQASSLNTKITSDIIISNAYVRASIPGTSGSSAYMNIANNNEKTVTLVKVISKISPRIEMHQHTMHNNMMKMRKVEGITINANSKVLLQPHGLHLMFFDLIKPLDVENMIEITLYFSNQQKITMQLPVRSLK